MDGNNTQILIMKRHSNNNTVPTPEYGWEEIARIIQTGAETTIDIPEYYSKVGFFIVAGGGGGCGDYNKSDCPGQGGNGGEVNNVIVDNVASSAVAKVGSGGIGGNKTTPDKNTDNGRTAGGDSYVVYNGVSYNSVGGYYGGYAAGYSKGNLLQTGNRGIGGCGAGLNNYPGNSEFADYFWNGKAGEGEDFDSTHSNTLHIHGGDGHHNPFDVFDDNLYGAGGGGGCDSYRGYAYTKTHFGEGGNNGGGNGGYGDNNKSQNKGTDAMFYGGGGGGAAFSSGHTYGQGGSGYQGVVIIYGKR